MLNQIVDPTLVVNVWSGSWLRVQYWQCWRVKCLWSSSQWCRWFRCTEASVVALLPVARWGPSTIDPCRYASVTTSERRARSLQPHACFRLVVPLHQLARRSPARLRLHHGGSVEDVHCLAASMWQQHAGSGGHANGKLKKFPFV